MHTAMWNGITRRSTLKDWAVEQREQLANAARDGDWPKVLELIDAGRSLVNVARLESRSGYTPLHQAAWHGASRDVVDALIQRGAARVLRTHEGEQAADIARRLGHDHLFAVLEPLHLHRVDYDELMAIEGHFHQLIRDRVSKLVDKHQLRMPVLETLLELDKPSLWFSARSAARCRRDTRTAELAAGGGIRREATRRVPPRAD